MKLIFNFYRIFFYEADTGKKHYKTTCKGCINFLYVGTLGGCTVYRTVDTSDIETCYCDKHSLFNITMKKL